MNHLNITNDNVDTELVAHALAYILPAAGYTDLLMAVSPEEGEIVLAFSSENAIGDFYLKTGLNPCHHVDDLVEGIMAAKRISITQVAVFELVQFPTLYFALEAIAFPNSIDLN
jgi:hypothetical protein